MAAVTIGTLRPATIAGYEVNDKAQAASDIVKGQLLVYTTAVPGSGYSAVVGPAPTSTLDPAGIALMDAKAGGLVSIGIHGEMDGFTALVQNTFLYSSPSVIGGIDTTLVAGAPNRIRAVSTTRIRFCFV